MMVATVDCSNLDPNGTTNGSVPDDGDNVEKLIKYYAMDIGVPVVCAFGMLGNILNFVVLTREKISISLTKMEKSAHIGLIGLAISDFMFCLMAFTYTLMPFQDKYFDMNIMLYYKWLGGPLITWFIITSTWLTVVMAGERYLAVCHPFKARKVISLRKTRVIILLIYVICLGFTIPLGFERMIINEGCDGKDVFSIRPRPIFTESVVGIRRLAWAIVFDIIPCIALLYFNVCLIYRIHHAKKMRNAMAPAQKKGVMLTKYPRELFSYKNCNNSASSNHNYVHKASLQNNTRMHEMSTHSRSSPDSLNHNHHQRQHTPQKRQMKARRRHTDNALNSVTATLVAVVVLFLILVSPSEVLKFYYLMSGGEKEPSFKIIRNITNLMQAINFSVNFILYCAVNKSFRNSLTKICCLCRRKGRQFHLHTLEKAYCHRVDFSESDT